MINGVLGFLLGLLLLAFGSFIVFRRQESRYRKELLSLCEEVSVLNTKLEIESQRERERDILREKLDLSLKKEGELKKEMGILEEKLRQEQGKSEEKEHLKKEMSSHFSLLADRALKENSDILNKHQDKHLLSLLNPLKENFIQFQKSFEDRYTTEAKERYSLVQEIKNLEVSSQRLGEDAQNLSKALKGNVKVQGDWGEMLLEGLLENSGLVKGTHFFTQESIRGEGGNFQRPDIVVRMPDDRHIVIDSKVNLVGWENYVKADTEECKSVAAVRLVKALESHVKSLSSKQYEKLYDFQGLDCVLMFIPVESVFYLAMESDSSFATWALRKNISLVTPTTLMLTLRIIENTWKIAERNRYAEEIARDVASLYDKFAGFAEGFTDIHVKLEAAQKSYNESLGRLCEGRGNVIRRLEGIRQKGIVSSKRIPSEMLERACKEETPYNSL